LFHWATSYITKVAQLSQETTLQGGLVMTKSGMLELGDNILRIF